MNEIIVKKLKTLRRIKPSASWLDSQRSFLLSEISREQNIKQGKTFGVFPFFNFSKLFKPAFALAFAIIVLISSFGTISIISAAQNSLPGDPLYSLKTAFERTQMQLIPGDENKARLSIKFVNQRMDEFTQLADQTDKAGSKENIDKTVKKITEQLVTVRENIDKLKATNAAKAAEVAKLVNSQAANYEQTLIKTGEQLTSIIPDEQITQDINQALDELKKTKETAGAILQNDSNNTNIDQDGENILVPSTEQPIESESLPFEQISE